MRNSKFQLLLGSSVVVSLGVLGAQGAVYQELGGQVVVEAEHFDSRTVDPTDNHHWHLVPDDNNSASDPLMDSPATYAEPNWINARGGKYVQSYPDSAGGWLNKNTDPSVVGTDPVLNYKVQITTT